MFDARKNSTSITKKSKKRLKDKTEGLKFQEKDSFVYCKTLLKFYLILLLFVCSLFCFVFVFLCFFFLLGTGNDSLK